MTVVYAEVEPTRTQIDALEGPAIIEFGAPWCGYCNAVQPLLAAALGSFPSSAHLKIDDGKGRPLGRSFRVTLWPMLIFLKDGKKSRVWSSTNWVARLFYELVELNRVAGFKLHDGLSLIQAGLDRFNTLHLLHGHTHGVGADPSIHPEDGDVDLPKLSAGGWRRNQCRE
jgi:thioredoxin 1